MMVSSKSVTATVERQLVQWDYFQAMRLEMVLFILADLLTLLKEKGGNEMNSSKTKNRYQLYLERRRAYLKEWRKRNPDKVKEYSKRAYEKLKEGKAID